MTMCETCRPVSNESTFSVLDIPASRSPSAETGLEPTTPVTSGLLYETPFAYYDPAGCSWRMSQGTLDLGLTPFFPTLPASGSMRNGRLYQRARWVPHICGSGCSVWPTPRAVMAKVKCHITPGRESHGNLEEEVAIRGQTGGYLNPRWIEWLMGFPQNWCVTPCTLSATP
jgi:hypothetical protein